MDMDIAMGPWMDFKVILFSIVAVAYGLIITLPRIRRELTLAETITCSLILLISILVIGLNLVKEIYPNMAHGFILAEVLATAEVGWFWMTLLRMEKLQRKINRAAADQQR